MVRTSPLEVGCLTLNSHLIASISSCVEYGLENFLGVQERQCL